MKTDQGATYAQIVSDILSTFSGPVEVDSLVNEILSRKTVNAKNPRTAVRAKIRELKGRVLIFPDSDHVLAIPLAFGGARFRIRLDHETVDQGVIPLSAFEGYLLPIYERGSIHLIDREGTDLSFVEKQISRQVKGLFGETTVDLLYLDLKAWFQRERMVHKDHILITIEDYSRPVFRLEREAYGQQNAQEIEARDRVLADILYQMLEAARSESIYIRDALPELYARLPDKRGTPPDTWQYIVAHDDRMFTNGFDIRYGDDDFLKQLQGFDAEPAKPQFMPSGKLTKEEEQKVYRFRAEFTHKPDIWREIEIQGKQNLANLDFELRAGFNHDTFDHMSGFWRLIERGGGGKKKRYREIDLADINPLEEGDGEDTQIASLDLKPGDRLKYVYDFGDWIEHTLTLQALAAPEKDVKYPREAARNIPKYEYCERCKARGKQTVATWICVDCSNEKGENVLLCEDCLQEHEDHYTEELTY